MKARFVFYFGGAALVLLAPSARSDTLYFRGGTNNFLSNGANWYFSDGMGGYTLANHLPNAGDNVVLQTDADGEGGTFQFSTLFLAGVSAMNGFFSAPTIAMTDGSGFQGSSVTVASGSQIQLSGTNFGCQLNNTTVTIQPGGTFAVAAGALVGLAGGTFISDAGVVLLGDQCVVNGVPGTNTLDILPGAELMSNGKVIIEAIGAPGPFTLNNNGTIVCNSGFLELSPTLVISTNGLALFQTPAPTALMRLDPPRIDPGVTFVLTGPGTNSLTGAIVNGTLQVGAVDIHTNFIPGNLQLENQAQITGTGLIHVLSTNGVASTLAATNAIFSFTTIDIDADVPFTIVNSAQFTSNVVNNAGTVRWTNTYGNPITFGGAAMFNNLRGATFLMLDNQAGLAQGPETLQSVFNNSGTFRVMPGNNTVPLGIAAMRFNNNGVLDVQGGTVNLNFGTHTGQFNVAAGATLVFSGPTNTLNPGASFIGPGMYQVYATLFVNGTSTIPNLELVNNSPVIDGPGQLTVGNNCTWTLGTIQGSGAFNVAPGATLTINGGVTLFQRTLNNSGNIIWTSPASLVSGQGVVFNNLAGGVFDIQTGAIFWGYYVPPVTTFNNFGTVRKSAGSAGTFGAYVNNAGALLVLTQGMNLPYPFQQTSGSTVLSPGTTVNASAGLTLLGGTLSGAGTVTGSLTNGGTVHPGLSPGVLTLSSGGSDIYSQSVSGNLNIDLGGLTPGTQYSQLAAPGMPVNLSGSLNVTLINGFVPSVGQQFTILTCGSRAGTFPVLNGTYLGSGRALVPVYSNTNVLLVVSNITVLQPPITVSRTGAESGSLELTWPSVIGQSYKVEYSGDLRQWFVLSNFVASTANSSMVDPAPIAGAPRRFYRLR